MTGIAGIVLAAGESRRMGRPKGLLPWHGSTFLETVVGQLALAELDPIVVIIGAHADAIRAQIALDRAQLIDNPEWMSGQASSLRAGINALPPGLSGAVIALVDQPHLDAALVRRLVTARAASGAPVVRPVWNGRGGHPILLGSEVFPRVRDAGPDATTFEIMNLFRGDFLDIPATDDSILIDFDTPDDLAREAPRFSQLS